MARTRKIDMSADIDLDLDDDLDLDADNPVAETHVATTAIVDDVEEDEAIEPPTLDDAFWALAEALQAKLEENQPELHHCEQVTMWYTDGNHAVAWAHLIAMLEGVLGARLARP